MEPINQRPTSGYFGGYGSAAYSTLSSLFWGVVDHAETLAKPLVLPAVHYVAGKKKAASLIFFERLLVEKNLRHLLSPISEELCRLFSKGAPDLFARLGGDEERIKLLFESLILSALHNLSHHVFPALSEAAEIGDVDERRKLNGSHFFSSVIFHVIKELKQDFIRLDHAVRLGVPQDDALFLPLAEKIVQLLLPDSEEGALIFNESLSTKVFRRLLVPHVISGLRLFFKQLDKGFSEEIKDEPVPLEFGRDPFSEAFRPMIPSIISFCIQSTSSFVAADAELNLEERLLDDAILKTIKALSKGLIERFFPRIKRSFPFFEAYDLLTFSNALQAILLKTLSTLVVHLPDEKVSSEALADLLTTILKDRLDETFRTAALLEKRGKAPKPKHFTNSARQLIALFFRGNEDILEVLFARFPQMESSLSALLFSFYQSFNKEDLPLYRSMLRTFFFDRDSIRAAHPSLPLLELPLSEEVSRLVGNEEIVDQLWNLSKHVGHFTAELVFDGLSEDVWCPHIALWLNNFLKLDLDDELETCLSGVFSSICQPGETRSSVRNLIEQKITLLVFKVIAILIHNAAREGDIEELKREERLFFVLKLLIERFSENWETIRLASKSEAIPKDEDIRDEYLHNLFRPLVQVLIQDALEFEIDGNQVELHSHLPFPQKISKWFSSLLKEDILPYLLSRGYLSLHSLIDSRQQVQGALFELYGNHRPAEGVRVISVWCKEAISFYFRDDPNSSASIVLEVLRPYLLTPPLEWDEKKEGLVPLQDQHLDLFNSLLSHAIKHLGQNRDGTFTVLYSFFAEYIEGILLNVLLGFSKRVHQIEMNYEMDPLKSVNGALKERITAEVLGAASSHFKEVNKLKETLDEPHAHLLPRFTVEENFRRRGVLHPVFQGSSESRFQYFQELATKLLPVLQLSKESGLPVPHVLKELVWDLFESLWLPHILRLVIDEAKAPYAIQSYLQSLLRSIEGSLEEADRGGKAVVKEDPLQRELEETCGALLEELIGLQPSAAEMIIRFRSVKKSAGVAVSASLRGALEKQSLLELVDLLFQGAIPALHPGGWVSDRAIEVYSITGKVPVIDPASQGDRFFPIIDEGGEKQMGFNFDYPKTSKEKEPWEMRRERERQKKRRVGEKALAKMIEQQTSLSIDAAIKGAWELFQLAFNKDIKETFGEPGVKLKKILDTISKLFWEYFLLPLLKITAYPLRELMFHVMKHYFASQAKLRHGDVESEIHQNLIFQVIDLLIDLFQEERPLRSSA